MTATGIKFIGPKRPDYEIERHCYSLEDVAKAHSEAGGHFFDAGAMRFFNSRICWASATFTDAGVYFVTSERYNYSSPRLYSVRFIPVTDLREIKDVSGFQAYATRAQAIGAMKEAAKE